MLQIQQPTGFDSDKNYFEVRLHLDWLGNERASLKPLAIPVDLATLMPAAWAVQVARGSGPVDPLEYFKLCVTAAGQRDRDVGQIHKMGGMTPVPTRHVVRDVLKTVIELNVILPAVVESGICGSAKEWEAMNA